MLIQPLVTGVNENVTADIRDITPFKPSISVFVGNMYQRTSKEKNKVPLRDEATSPVTGFHAGPLS